MEVLLARYKTERGLDFSLICRKMEGRSGVLNTRKVIRHSSTELSAAGVGAAIACFDKNCHGELSNQTALTTAQAEVDSAGLPFSVHYYPVEYALESWLAADLSAWHRAIIRLPTPPLPSDILTKCAPKKAIEEHFQARGEEFRYMQHDPQVAQALDIDAARRTSANLDGFFTLVDCLTSSA